MRQRGNDGRRDRHVETTATTTVATHIQRHGGTAPQILRHGTLPRTCTQPRACTLPRTCTDELWKVGWMVPRACTGEFIDELWMDGGRWTTEPSQTAQPTPRCRRERHAERSNRRTTIATHMPQADNGGDWGRSPARCHAHTAVPHSSARYHAHMAAPHLFWLPWMDAPRTYGATHMPHFSGYHGWMDGWMDGWLRFYL